MTDEPSWKENIDRATVRGFGQEWSRFDQTALTDSELEELCRRYFTLIDFSSFDPSSVAVDAGCGSGRWASIVGKKVGLLYAVDASEEALDVARRRLSDRTNIVFHHSDLNDLRLDDESVDLIYSLGVLHHIPNTAAAIKALAMKLKPGGSMLVYLYYNFENRPFWYRLVWRMSDRLRVVISRLPFPLKRLVSDLIALCIYLPLARLCTLLGKIGVSSERIPLAYYRDSSFYTMRTDALDRFGTRLEQRFSRNDIANMLKAADLTDIRFQETEPYWCAVARKPI